jgi:hypothetical protein
MWRAFAMMFTRFLETLLVKVFWKRSLMMIFFLTIHSSCSLLRSTSTGTLKVWLLGKEQKVFEQKIGSKAELLETLNRRRNFLVNLFTQSYDSYTGTPRWDLSCLNENKIGEIKEDRHGVYFTSVLYLNSSLEAGFCSDTRITQLRKYYVVYYGCAKNSSIVRLILSHQNNQSDHHPKWNELCDL